MKKIIFVTITLAAIFSSCKKGGSSNDDPTPATAAVTPKAITRSDLYPENGFISGTISSKLANGDIFQTTFNHELDVEIPTFYQNADGRYVIHLNKADKSGRIGTQDKQTEMTFVLKLANDGVYSLQNFNMSVYVDSTAISITKFEVEQTIASNAIMTITNVNFSPASGKFSADYTMSFTGPDYTSSKKNATITGKISTTLTNVRYRTGSN